jgi:protoporphyrinogen oxidase
VLSRFKYVIIGAGPTGLGAAYRLRELGEKDFIVLEGTSQVGGLATSFKDEKGFTWDIGGHVQFSHYKYFDELMLKALGSDGWLKHQRESWAWMRERFVPYPVQNNIKYLPKEVMWNCLQGLIKIYKDNAAIGTASIATASSLLTSVEKPANFYEWILAVFGQGLAEEFMLPYNFKVWAFDPKYLSYSWIGERVAVTDLERVTKNILFDQDDISWGPNNLFQFPRTGGTGAIWERVADLAGRENILLNQNVQTIDLNAKHLKVSSAGSADAPSEIEYEHLINTMPLDIFCQKAKGLPSDLISSSSRLKFSSSNIVGIGLKGAPPDELYTKCWMYFPETNCPFYRVTVFSNYSPQNVPDIKTNWSLMAEISESPDKPVNRETLIDDTINGMLATKLIKSADDVISTWKYSADHGYPTPSLERDDILKQVLPALEKFEVYSRGRFGAWKYEVSNQDHSLMQGVELISRLVHGTPEETLVV